MKTVYGVALLAVAAATWAADVAVDPAATRAKYAKEPASILKIAEPVSVSRCISFKDGGTVCIELTDAPGRKHLFALDGRNLPTKEHPNEPGTRNLYLGAEHPEHKGARMVSFRGPEESALYGVMLRWADRHPQRKALYDPSARLPATEFGNLGEAREFFLRLDSRFTQ